MSFAYKATPNGKESSQLFEVGVAIFLEGGKCYWCRDCCLIPNCCLVCNYCLVRICGLVRICDIYL